MLQKLEHKVARLTNDFVSPGGHFLEIYRKAGYVNAMFTTFLNDPGNFRRFDHRFAGCAAPVGAYAAYIVSFYDGDFRAQLGQTNGTGMAGRTAADNYG
jgi:hypothetical protein